MPLPKSYSWQDPNNLEWIPEDWEVTDADGVVCFTSWDDKDDDDFEKGRPGIYMCLRDPRTDDLVDAMFTPEETEGIIVNLITQLEMFSVVPKWLNVEAFNAHNAAELITITEEKAV